MFPETGLHPCTSRTTCPQKNWELTFELKKYICITATLINLHWLPVKSHITYKILFLTHKSFSALGPQSDLLHSYTQSWMLQSSAMNLLSFPCSNLHTFGDRAFSVAPTLWNSLPSKLCSAPSTDLFQKLLKTHLFPVVCLYSFIKHSGLPWTALYKSKLYYYYKKWKGKKRRRGAYPIYQNYLDSLKDFKPVLNIKRPFASWMKMFLPQALKCILDAKCASHFLVSPSLFSNNYCDNNIPRVHSSNILFIGHAVSWCYTLLLHIPAKFYTQSSQESDLSWTNLVLRETRSVFMEED